MTEEYETSTMSTSGTRIKPTVKNMDNLAQLGLEDPVDILPNKNLR
jgi:hypothetical protein